MFIHIPRSGQFLFERDEPMDRLTNASYIINHGMDVWVKEFGSLRRDPVEVVRAFVEERNNGESLREHVLEGFEFLARMDISDRAQNGFRLSLLTDNHDNTQLSEFGHILYRAYNNPVFSDHNHEHNRRVERWIESMLLNIGPLRHSGSVKSWVDSAFLFAYFHDIDQLLTLQRNYERPNGDKHDLPAKKGHALAAAVMLLSLYERYSQERLVSADKAWEICVGSAYMILRHDEPESLDAILNGGEKAYRFQDGNFVFMSGQELSEKFNANRLDLTTLTGSQIVELLKAEKSKTGFMVPGSRFGLLPSFESEYALELSSLETDRNGLFAHIPGDCLTALKSMTEVVVKADVIEMVAPPEEAVLRTFMTQYSLNRPFWRDIREDDYMAKNDFTRSAPENIRPYLQAITLGPGNVEYIQDSDVRRILWEFLHASQLLPESGLTQSRYIKKVDRENIIRGILAFKKYGREIMRGRIEVLDGIYLRRLNEISRKALVNSGLDPLQMRIFLSLAGAGFDRIQTVADSIARRDSGLSARYVDKAGTLIDEMESVKAGISGKPHPDKNGSGGLYIYSKADIEKFSLLCDLTLEMLRQQFGMSRRKLNRFKLDAWRGRFGSTTPYRTYDSLGSPLKVRTLVRPRPEVSAILLALSRNDAKNQI